jgi:hypothetical protein
VEDLVSELEAARVAADAAESSRAALQQQLSVLVEEKERAELSSDMVTRQTQVGGGPRSLQAFAHELKRMCRG